MKKLKGNGYYDHVSFLLQGYELLNIAKNDFDELKEGKCPNLNMFSIEENTLTNHNRFVFLPPYHEDKQDVKKIVPEDYPKISQKDPRWLQLRKGWISASNAATWMGFFEMELLKHLDLPVSWHDPQKKIDLILEIFEKNIQEKEHLNDHVNGDDITTIFGKKRICMEWGRIHEKNAIKVILDLYPHLKIYETGFYPLSENILNQLLLENSIFGKEEKNNFPKIGASPDGIIEDSITGIRMVLECKCPCPFIWNEEKKIYQYMENKIPYQTIPIYYIPQVILQMLCTGLDICLFVCWTPEKGCSLFRVHFDKILCIQILQCIKHQFVDSYEKINQISSSKTITRNYLNLKNETNSEMKEYTEEGNEKVFTETIIKMQNVKDYIKNNKLPPKASDWCSSCSWRIKCKNKVMA